MQSKQQVGFLALLVLSVVLTSAVTAEGSQAAAKSAFRDGQHLFDDGQYAAAAEAFRRAMTLSPSWKIYYNIGHSEAAAKNYGRALEAFQLYLAEAGDALPEDRQDEVFDQIDQLKKKAGAIRIKAPSGADIYINGVLRGTAPVGGSIMVVAGKQNTLVVKQAETVLFERGVRVWAQEVAEIEVSAEPEEEAPAEVEVPISTEVASPVSPEDDNREEPDTPAEEDVATTVSSQTDTASTKGNVMQTVEQKHPLRITGGILLAIGGIGLAGGGTTGVLAIFKSQGLDDECPNQVCAPENTRLDTTKKLAIATNIALPVGGVLAVTGVVLMVAGRKKERRLTGSVSVAPIVLPGVAGMTLGGRF